MHVFFVVHAISRLAAAAADDWWHGEAAYAIRDPFCLVVVVVTHNIMHAYSIYIERDRTTSQNPAGDVCVVVVVLLLRRPKPKPCPHLFSPPPFGRFSPAT